MILHHEAASLLNGPLAVTLIFTILVALAFAGTVFLLLARRVGISAWQSRRDEHTIMMFVEKAFVIIEQVESGDKHTAPPE